MTEFTLTGHEYIGLNQLLKILGLVESGGDAKMRIQGGEVTVNDAVETQVRKKLRVGDVVVFEGQTITVK